MAARRFLAPSQFQHHVFHYLPLHLVPLLFILDFALVRLPRQRPRLISIPVLRALQLSITFNQFGPPSICTTYPPINTHRRLSINNPPLDHHHHTRSDQRKLALFQHGGSETPGTLTDFFDRNWSSLRQGGLLNPNQVFRPHPFRACSNPSKISYDAQFLHKRHPHLCRSIGYLTPLTTSRSNQTPSSVTSSPRARTLRRPPQVRSQLRHGMYFSHVF